MGNSPTNDIAWLSKGGRKDAQAISDHCRGGCHRRRAGRGRDRHHRHGQQRRHDRHAEAVLGLRGAASGHRPRVGRARGERAAPARDDRHRHRGRPVRRHDDRDLRGADLGGRGLARADGRSGRRLRHRGRAGAGARRPVLRGHALCAAVLRRELDDVLSQGPVRRGRHRGARAADLGGGRAAGPSSCTIQATRCTASACAASQAGARTWRSCPRS